MLTWLPSREPFPQPYFFSVTDRHAPLLNAFLNIVRVGFFDSWTLFSPVLSWVVWLLYNPYLRCHSFLPVTSVEDGRHSLICRGKSVSAHALEEPIYNQAPLARWRGQSPSLPVQFVWCFRSYGQGRQVRKGSWGCSFNALLRWTVVENMSEHW